MIDVIDLRGLALSDEARKTAYPRDDFKLGESMRYIHLLSTRWYYDASKPEHASEADKAIAALCFEAETWDKGYSKPYKPFRVVVDNFGGTIIGKRP